MEFKTKELLHELKHHLPFTAIASLIGISSILFINYILQANISESIFEVIHPIHIIFSAIVTSAIFYSYQKNKLKAILVGITGAILIGSVSDTLFPYLGGLIFRLNVQLHLPIINEPIKILTFALIGASIGTLTTKTKMSHALHVFLSVFARSSYLLAFSQNFNTLFFIAALIIIIIAVIIPCCVSDIIFPFFFLNKKIKCCKC